MIAAVADPAPVLAGSTLSAWRVSPDRGIELRTAPGTPVRAYYEEGSQGAGPRIWFDLPGAPLRRRSLTGAGLLQEVRVGQPDGGTTRLVLEFRPGLRLDPRQLRLVGTSRDRWRMDLRQFPPRSLPILGEGQMESSAWPAQAGKNLGAPRLSPLLGRGQSNLANTPLPRLRRGRYLVVIDPGHGGPDPGAIGIQGLRETDVVLDVALQTARLLQSRGVQVLLTRTSEVDVDLPPRVELANRSQADLFVSLHANALTMDRPDVNGIETFYYEGGLSYGLANALQQRLMAISPGTPDRGARPGRFFVIRRTVMPSVLTEMGFVTGEIDAPRLASRPYRRQLAQALAAGILSFLTHSS
jgi:N-acetylmuramoyl-L-alanine amidase